MMIDRWWWLLCLLIPWLQGCQTRQCPAGPQRPCEAGWLWLLPQNGSQWTGELHCCCGNTWLHLTWDPDGHGWWDGCVWPGVWLVELRDLPLWDALRGDSILRWVTERDVQQNHSAWGMYVCARANACGYVGCVVGARDIPTEYISLCHCHCTYVLCPIIIVQAQYSYSTCLVCEFLCANFMSHIHTYIRTSAYMHTLNTHCPICSTFMHHFIIFPHIHRGTSSFLMMLKYLKKPLTC